jgi:AraC family transcriptional regulator
MSNSKLTSIKSFIRGDSRVLLTSTALDWSGLTIEQHEAFPGERAESTIDQHLLIMVHSRSVERVDRAGAGRALVPQVVRPGDLCIHPKGAIPPIRPTYAPNLLFCALDPAFVNRVGEGLQDQSRMRSAKRQGAISSYRPSFTDRPTRQLLTLLRQEALAGGQSGRLYVEHLTYALIARLFTLDEHSAESSSLLEPDPRRLRHVIDRIRADPGGAHNAEELAAETGYSASHFFRVFRATTGCTPHQYLLRLRMERAIELMRKPSLALLDIALECGFANETHFSRTFRERFGSPPGQFRRERFSRTGAASKELP